MKAELKFRLSFCILACVVLTLCDYLIITVSFPFLSRTQFFGMECIHSYSNPFRTTSCMNMRSRELDALN